MTMELDRLEQALHEHGAVIRLQQLDGRAVVQLWWMPPTGFAQNLRPFLSAMPGGFIRDLRANGFAPAPADEQPAPDHARHIFAGAWESEVPDALPLAQVLAAAHFIIECPE